MPTRLLTACLAAIVVAAASPVPAHAVAPVPKPHKAHTNVHSTRLARPAVSPAAPNPNPDGYIPCDIAAAYRLNQAPGDGTGLTIAIIDAFHLASAPGDYTAFASRFGIGGTPTLEVHPMGNPATMAKAEDKGWADEIDLDVEWAHGIAPNATIVLVEAVGAMDTDLLPAVDWAVGTRNADIVSMSWSIDETALTAQDVALADAHFPPTNGAGKPVAYLAATGDKASAQTVGWPSDSTRVIAVGGTSVAASATGEPASPGHTDCSLAVSPLGVTPQNETVWPNAISGPSAIVPRPAFQSRVSSAANRVVPDVALAADTNLAVYASASRRGQPPPGWLQLGGDSGATAIMAAVLARLNTGRAPVTQVSDLYLLANPAGFNDVVNGNSGGSGGTPSYPAGPGFDLATGWGSPKVTSLFPRGWFTPVPPSRVIDTRSPGTGQHGRLTAGQPIEVALPTPPSPSSAAVVNLTAINPDSPGGWVAAYPGGTAHPGNSNLNTTPGGLPIANLVQVPVGANGKIAFLSSSDVDLAVDIFGWVSDSTTPPAGAARLVPVTPQRIIDSRPQYQVGPYSTPWSALATRTINVSSVVPASATSVVVNLTAADASAPGWLAAFPSAYNGTSNVNYVPGYPVPNRVIVPLDASRSFKILSSASANVVVDISGYYDAGASNAVTFTIGGPLRIYDSRPGTVAVTGQADGPLAGRGTRKVYVGGLGGIPAGLKAAALNVTVGTPAQVGFLAAQPGGTPWSGNSDLNFVPGPAWTNQVIVPVALDGSVDFFNGSFGAVNLIVDFLGWYG